ncbi:MAG: T9SS type A sorting domain-containing protein [Bacteroidota bacterium]
MKQFIIIIGLATFICLNSNAQKASQIDWVVYENTTDLPELTQASESILTEGEVTIVENAKVIFRTLPEGAIHLNGHFKVEQGAFFHAHKADFERNELETRSTAVETDLAINLSSYPNPFTDRLFLEFQLPQAAQITINLFDASGRLVQNIATDKYLDAGNQQVEIATSNLVAGMYHAQLIADGQSFQTSLVKVKN